MTLRTLPLPIVNSPLSHAYLLCGSVYLAAVTSQPLCPIMKDGILSQGDTLKCSSRRQKLSVGVCVSPTVYTGTVLENNSDAALHQAVGPRSSTCSLSDDSSKSHTGDVKCSLSQLVGHGSRPRLWGAKLFLVSLKRATKLCLEFHDTHSSSRAERHRRRASQTQVIPAQHQKRWMNV